MKLLKKIKSLVKREKTPKLHATEIYLMSEKEMFILAEGVYEEEIKKKMNVNGSGVKFTDETENFIHFIFLRGYNACYQHILEMITGQLSIEDLIRKQT